MTQDQQVSSTFPCPKCGSDMRQYARIGVITDRCTGCRGILLDRGGLERLTEVECGYYGSSGLAVPQAPERREYEDRGREEREGGHEAHASPGRTSRRAVRLTIR